VLKPTDQQRKFAQDELAKVFRSALSRETRSASPYQEEAMRQAQSHKLFVADQPPCTRYNSLLCLQFATTFISRPRVADFGISS
jgi:hypothetical protein